MPLDLYCWRQMRSFCNTGRDWIAMGLHAWPVVWDYGISSDVERSFSLRLVICVRAVAILVPRVNVNEIVWAHRLKPML